LKKFDQSLFIKEVIDKGDYERSLETAVKSALAQIEEKKYESELLQRGINAYKKLAIVFKGKEVTVKEG
jgi:hypothetical protein